LRQAYATGRINQVAIFLFFIKLIKGKLGARETLTSLRTPGFAIRNSIHDKKVTSLMSKKFASAWKATTLRLTAPELTSIRSPA